jgi:cytochrome c oxidase subunit 2
MSKARNSRIFHRPPRNRSERTTLARRSSLAMLALAVISLTGCAGWPSAPAGPQAARIAGEWWLFLSVSAAVYIVVMLALTLALVRRPRATQHVESELPPAVSRRLTVAVGCALGITILILLSLLVEDFFTGRSIEAFGAADPLIINVIGHQYWWEVEYVDAVASNRFTTANEIHIPVGRPVELSLTSSDVIHSFWVPELHGKRDLIPAYGRRLRIQADRPGTYRGQCAEFCGYQHAKMRVLVIAEAPDAFANWQAAQRQPARAPSNAEEKHGQLVFLSGSCVLCHTIQGTPAGGKVAPDLTHLAARTTIGAGAAPNTEGHLAVWVLDPQSIKPGCNMPANPMAPDDLHALVIFLKSLA